MKGILQFDLRQRLVRRLSPINRAIEDGAVEVFAHAITLVGDAVTSLGLTTTADRLGRKRTLVIGAALMLGAGIGLVLLSRQNGSRTSLSSSSWVFINRGRLSLS